MVLPSNTSQCLLIYVFFFNKTPIWGLMDIFTSPSSETPEMVFLDEEAEAKRPQSFGGRRRQECGISSADPLKTSDATWRVLWVPHFTLNT